MCGGNTFITGGFFGIRIKKIIKFHEQLIIYSKTFTYILDSVEKREEKCINTQSEQKRLV